jgi:hypothetical protein
MEKASGLRSLKDAMFISQFNRPNRLFDGTKFLASADQRKWREMTFA